MWYGFNASTEKFPSESPLPSILIVAPVTPTYTSTNCLINLNYYSQTDLKTSSLNIPLKLRAWNHLALSYCSSFMCVRLQHTIMVKMNRWAGRKFIFLSNLERKQRHFPFSNVCYSIFPTNYFHSSISSQDQFKNNQLQSEKIEQ